MKQTNYLIVSILLIFVFFSCDNEQGKVNISGEMKQWHTIVLNIDGPLVSENDVPNPFLNYRLNVEFSKGNKIYLVPGFFAADGNAANTGAEKGNKWRVNFVPDEPGTWNYRVSFRKGENISIVAKADTGISVAPDGFQGTFQISPSDKKGRDFRAKGRVVLPDAEKYLKFKGSGEYFMKSGADSPENFLAYVDFDQTHSITGKVKLKDYAPHLESFREGDPTWGMDKGKGIIGALNYLAAQNVNSVYMLTMNIQGDGNDVWPWNDENERYRFDCSKLDQWDIVFTHMDTIGMMKHFVLQETENECLLDIGWTETQRKLYLREIVARFGHYLGITWNFGEENGIVPWSKWGQDKAQKHQMANYFKSINPYDNYLVVHTHSRESDRQNTLNDWLGFKNLDGFSFQVHHTDEINQVVQEWMSLAADSGHVLAGQLDEIGPANLGVVSDSADPGHDIIRKEALWGSLMAGANGVEWYFGYKNKHNDLTTNDFSTRKNMWFQTHVATKFFATLPLNEMSPNNSLTANKNDYVFAAEPEIYVIYLPEGGSTAINLDNQSNYEVKWYNPREGGSLMDGSITTVKGNMNTRLGNPPKDDEKDWVILLKKI